MIYIGYVVENGEPRVMGAGLKPPPEGEAPEAVTVIQVYPEYLNENEAYPEVTSRGDRLGSQEDWFAYLAQYCPRPEAEELEAAAGEGEAIAGLRKPAHVELEPEEGEPEPELEPEAAEEPGADEEPADEPEEETDASE